MQIISTYIRYLIASLILVSILTFYACQSFEPDKWEQNISNVGSSSSPKAIDLNADGVLDIVMGAGAMEFKQTEHGVIALDGTDGNMLWKVPARNQIVGSPIFQDVTGDGTPDVFIGGRSAILYAIDGKDGTVIWEYLKDDPSADYYNDTTILNFNGCQWINDINDDGIKELIAGYGGFVKAPPEQLDRPSGKLMIFSGKTGELIAQAAMPDGKESYTCPVIYRDNTGILDIIFGTGGENIDGSLYRVNLKEVLNDDISNAIKLASGNGKGFIAPPLITDVNLDGTQDVVINSVDGRLIAIDGTDNSELWIASLPGEFDSYTMPAYGQFTGNDDYPDFFVSNGVGPWPDTKHTIHSLIDGATGDVVFKDTLGSFQYASPLVLDYNDDGKDDVLLAINRKIKNKVGMSTMEFFGTELIVFPSGQENPISIYTPELGTNLGSTPLLQDIDGDNNLDLIYSLMSDPHKFYSFKNLKVVKTEFNLHPRNIKLGSYME